MAALGYGCAASGSWISLKNSKVNNSNGRKRGLNVTCASSALTDPYKTLRINPDASESEVRRSFRQLALQYHPDVCRGSNCGVQFHHINEAYDMVMSNLRGETEGSETESSNVAAAEYNPDEPMWGMHDSNWEDWEEWMGWEGAGIRDYSSHINPSI